MQGFLYTHMTSRRVIVVIREDVMAEGQRDNNEHQQLLVILD